MSIIINEEKNLFTLQTNSTSYQMKVDDLGLLLHTYYGKKIPVADMSYNLNDYYLSFSPYDFIGEGWKPHSVDILPQEISTFGNGDFRESAINLRQADGSLGLELRYDSYTVEKGKYSLEGLPSFYGDNAETLIVTLKDKIYDIYVHLYYGVFEEYDLITRAVKIENKTGESIHLEKAMISLDFFNGDYDLVTFHGKHMKERMLQRNNIFYGTTSVGSTRGASSHMQNPFAILCDKDANEEYGNVYGFGLVYSGSFLISASKSHLKDTRVNVGINPENFNYEVEAGGSFTTPEVAMVYSSEGFGKMSRCYHKAIRNNLCRGKFKTARRPVLINNWEGTYFNFNADKLVSMAEDASKIGIELFVMDDGWFGKRDDDHSGLGDWKPNEKKLQGTLKELADRINNTGMKFGIWFEPECISEDSDLYREHPDYAFKMPNRKPSESRNQLIVDMSRKEVRDNIYNQLEKVLNSANISYVKWDFNRHISDLYSVALPKDKQGEVFHRYILGLYELLERITTNFPDVLFESCSGGGGRFDMGMLYYMPQVWTSDNTDPIDRLDIQYGTSFAYPVSTMGAHVSASPNHGTARVTPLKTRGIVAYFGTYGVELDINKMSDEEKTEIQRQILEFKKHYDLIQYGEYFRLKGPFDETKYYTVWEVAKEDGSEAIVASVRNRNEAGLVHEIVKLKGLISDKFYRINGGEQLYLGGALMEHGLKMEYDFFEYPARLYHITLSE
ncbi:MAG: alpha-galactosidase [Clostridia bacterium]|nr:alpha-galactosidase [Clostridia bacterium]